jgi:hypothetical protein
VELLVFVALLTVILGLLGGIVGGVQLSFQTQRPQLEAANNASAALETLTRVIRLAGVNTTQQALDPGVQVSGQYNSIRLRADWNPVDGNLLGTWEDVQFTTNNGALYKQEFPADAAPVLFLNHVQTLRFTYRDRNLNVLANAATDHAQIALVEILLTTRTPDGTTRNFSTSVHVRSR